MGTWKSKNIKVNTYTSEGLGDILDFPTLYVNRIANALTELNSNWEISSPSERYIEAPETISSGGCSTVEIHNKTTDKYFRLWWVTSSTSRPSSTTSGAGVNYTMRWGFYNSPTNLPTDYGNILNVYKGNVVIGRGTESGSTIYNTVAVPSGMIIGVASHPIEKNLCADLGLDIPLFGFNFNNLQYSNAYTYSGNYRGYGVQFGSGYQTSSTYYHPRDYSYSGVDNIAVFTDGDSLAIIDAVDSYANNSYRLYNCMLYSRTLFKPFDSDDGRKDGAFCKTIGYQYTTGSFASYVDKSGNKINDSSYYSFSVNTDLVKNLSSSDNICFSPAIPLLAKNSNSYTTVFGSTSPSKGTISTDFVRCCDPDVVKYGNTLDGGKWVCVLDGVLFPSDPSNPSLV